MKALEVLTILAKLSEEYLENQEEEYPSLDVEWNELSYELSDAKVLDDGVTIQVVKDFGGEGMGDQRYLVFKVSNWNDKSEKDAQYFRKDGWYASHYGSEFDGDFYEVKPVKKTITVYDQVK